MQESFLTVCNIVNFSFYPLGIILFALLIWPVYADFVGKKSCLQRGGGVSRLGPGIVVICLVAWVTSGVVFPVALRGGRARICHLIFTCIF